MDDENKRNHPCAYFLISPYFFNYILTYLDSSNIIKLTVIKVSLERDSNTEVD